MATIKLQISLTAQPKQYESLTASCEIVDEVTGDKDKKYKELEVWLMERCHKTVKRLIKKYDHGIAATVRKG